ncbi:MAG: lipopolysaccharide heptosyltransferase family protein [Candidatus Hydrogenedentota bacterium]|nr:MAG: lipopolysaccharide heptosyltransferase family protein [Candidatus Hydrogenedentota bacterium]
MSPKRIKKILKYRLSHPRILVVRNDGLGDFIHSLPFIASLRKQLPSARIYVLIHRNNQKLIPMLPQIDGSILDDGVLLKRHIQNMPKKELRIKRRELLEEIKAYRFDAAIFLYAEKESAKLIAKAGIPIRVGSFRRLWFYRFNAWNFDSRKYSDLPEYMLNIHYLSVLGLRPRFEFPKVEIPEPVETTFPETKKTKGKKKVTSKSRKKKQNKFVLIHPIKRNQTALSWPEKYFRKLIRDLIRKNKKIILIGDSADEKAIKKFSRSFKTEEKNHIETKTNLSFFELARLMKQSEIFIGNSSGPLQLAGLLQVPHIGFYPKNHVSSIYRWRTLEFQPQPELESFLLQPNVDKDCIVCLKEKCEFFNCMEKIPVDKALQAMQEWEKFKSLP